MKAICTIVLCLIVCLIGGPANAQPADSTGPHPVGVDDPGTALEAGGEFNGTAGANGVGNVLTNDTDVDSAAGGETRTVTAVRLGAEGTKR